ncbi:MAG: DUF933 domain-containing protein [Candidatus Omnitrophica bacterium]|nr:DUF933 domain-containing protein [Candidatus Omnitrophota bacterium]
MKIGLLKCDIFSQGKTDLYDERVKILRDMFNSPKEVYIQIEIICDEKRFLEADCLIVKEDAKLDLIVSDMEFVETRLERTDNQQEQMLLDKLKEQLESGLFLNSLTLNEQEKTIASAYSLLTMKAVVVAEEQDLTDKHSLLMRAYQQAGYISFFTAGEKDAHAWPLKKGLTAYDAAGVIHTAIKQGFIRAEVVNFKELVADGSLSKARANNHVRLETKEYVVQDGDYLIIRTNK